MVLQWGLRSGAWEDMPDSYLPCQTCPFRRATGWTVGVNPLCLWKFKMAHYPQFQCLTFQSLNAITYKLGIYGEGVHR
jgi:hypothetical protein